MSRLPSGTIAFLFTDIEGSTRLWDQNPKAMQAAIEQHNTLLVEAIESHGGHVFKIIGDEFQAAFTQPLHAVEAALAAQRALVAEDWGDVGEIKVRMGIHVGPGEVVSDDYAVSHTLNRVARVSAAGHGGQILLSSVAADLVRGLLPERVDLRDMGEHHFKGLSQPEHVYQILAPELPQDFPALKSLGIGALESTAPPAFLEEGATQPVRPLFVGRERQLIWLEEGLQLVLDPPPPLERRGSALFITGEAGMGKSSLLQAFADRAAQAIPELLVIWGSGNALIGGGDAYHPFRQALGMLSGDLDQPWLSGTITTEQARRLWDAVPLFGQAISEGDQLLPSALVDSRGLLARVSETDSSESGWGLRLSQMVWRSESQPPEVSKDSLHQGCEAVLRSLSEKHPLLLLLDDLQWADNASLNLLFHLGRNLSDSRVLIVGAYRPIEVTLGRESTRHPLERVVSELRRISDDLELDLEQTGSIEDRAFVDNLLDSEPNAFGEGFRIALFAHTQGQPLFTVEMLRFLKEQGVLHQDENGTWRASTELVWDALPQRVEGVIEARIDRLDDQQREILAAAAVEGDQFTALVVARVLDIDQRRLLRNLSRELGRGHQLVQEHSLIKIGKHKLSRYRFAHTLFQQYLYNDLSQNERQTLHAGIAEALESIYSDQTEEITVELARHYSEAGEDEKALPYLIHSGDQARAVYAHQEAIQSYQKAISTSTEMGDLELAARTLMKLGLTYHNAFEFEASRQAYEEGFSLWQRVGMAETEQLPPAPHAMRFFSFKPTSLDPGLGGFGSYATRHLFSRLTKLSPEMDVLPDVAHSWEVLEDGYRYTFHLRDDVLWNDDQPVTAADFDYAWKRVLDPSTRAGQADLLYVLKNGKPYHQGEIVDSELVGVHSRGEFILEVELEEPTGYFLHLLTSGIASPVPQHVVRHWPETWTEPHRILTNGPFRLQAVNADEDHPSMVFEANPTYHGRFSGNLARVKTYFYTEYMDQLLNADEVRRSRWQLYDDDVLDYVSLQGLNPQEIAHARNWHADEMLSRPLFSTASLIFNLHQLPFDDLRVRRAFALATNRERWASIALSGLHFPATGGLIPPGMPGHAADIALPFDPDQARHLLAEAGYPDGNGLPELSFIAPYWAEWSVRQEEFLRTLWLEILGIEVSFEWLNWPEYRRRLELGTHHMYVSGWSADFVDPDSYLRFAVSELQNGWQNTRYERLIEEARRSTNQEERLELYQSAENILLKEVPILPAYYRRDLGLLKPWVKKAPYLPIHEEAWLWEDIIIAPH